MLTHQKNENSVEVWTPHKGPQTEALARSEDEVLNGGARGGGKTEAGLAWMAEPEYVKNPEYKGLVLRKNYDDLSDWIARAKVFYASIATVTGKPPLIKFKSGAFIRLGHFKDAKTFDKYLGHEYHKLLIEEITKVVRTETDYLKLLSCNRSTIPELKAQCFLTTNPGGPGHIWVRKRFVNCCRNKTFIDPISGKSRIFIPSRVEDNPTLMERDPQYIHFLNSLPEKLRLAWRFGDWSVYEGQYFENWKDAFFKQMPRSPEFNHFIAMDYGHTAPASVGFYEVLPDNKVHRYDGIYVTGQSYEALGKLIKEKAEFYGYRYQFIVSDPAVHGDKSHHRYSLVGESGADTIQNITGINVIRADNRRVIGWGRVRIFMENDMISFAPHTHEAVETITTLTHDEHNPEDVDTDGEDHVGDEVRYALMTRPEPNIIPKVQEHGMGLRGITIDFGQKQYFEEAIDKTLKQEAEVYSGGGRRLDEQLGDVW